MANGFQESGTGFTGKADADPRLAALLALDHDKAKLHFRENLIHLMESQRVTAADLSRKTGISKGTIDKLRPFIVCADWTPGGQLDDTKLRARLTSQPAQLSLF